jgi:FixJ family two-component response regulator
MERQRHTIAVVDDDDTVRDSLRALLETHGYAVIDFADGNIFLDRDGGVVPDCVILDVHMPGKSGLDVLRTLRQAGDMTPVILISGRNDRMIEARVQLEPSATMLDKPVARARLFAAIESALSK